MHELAGLLVLQDHLRLAVWHDLGLHQPVLRIVLDLLDAGLGGEPERLALHDHVLQGYGLLWVALMVIGVYG